MISDGKIKISNWYEIAGRIEFSPSCILDFDQHIVLRGKENKHVLSKKEFRCLQFMAYYCGQTILSERIYDQVWEIYETQDREAKNAGMTDLGLSGEGTDAYARQNVRDLVSKIRAIHEELGKRIVTVRGYGYRFELYDEDKVAITVTDVAAYAQNGIPYGENTQEGIGFRGGTVQDFSHQKEAEDATCKDGATPKDASEVSTLSGIANLSEADQSKLNSIEWRLLPSVNDESAGKTYAYHATGDYAPLVELFKDKVKQGYRYFYLFEGQRLGSTNSFRGGTGKTCSLLSFSFMENTAYTPYYYNLYRVYRDNPEHSLLNELVRSIPERNGANTLLLLDGLDEIPSSVYQQKCIKEVMDWGKQHPTSSAIIVSGRDPIDIYIQGVGEDGDEVLDQQQIEECISLFQNCKVLSLTDEQRQQVLGETQPSKATDTWSILDNPFFVSRYLESKLTLGSTASRWRTKALEEWEEHNYLQTRTSLMLGSLLHEVDRLSEGSVSLSEQRRFFLTKTLPSIAYRVVLQKRVSSELREGKKRERDIDNEYLDSALWATLDAYSNAETIGIWSEYSGTRNRAIFKQSWSMYWSENSGWTGKKPPDILYLVGPWTIDGNYNYSFSHEIYEEFFAALHIANVVYALANGMCIEQPSDVSADLFYVEMETFDHEILRQAEEVLELNFGLAFQSDDINSIRQCLNGISPLSIERAVLVQVFARFLEANISASSSMSSERNAERKALCHQCFQGFCNRYDCLENEHRLFAERYKSYYLYATCLLARDLREGRGCGKDLEACEQAAQKAILFQKTHNVLKVDGFLQLGLLYNTLMEHTLNSGNLETSIIPDEAVSNRVYDATKEIAAGSMRAEEVDNLRSDLLTAGTKTATKSVATACFELLHHAKTAYLEAPEGKIKCARRFGFASKAYLTLAAMGTSGGALNILGLMLCNQTNAMERYAEYKRYGDEIEQPWQVRQNLYNDNYVKGYLLYMVVCNLQRGSQPYSNIKIIELLLKGHVSLDNGQIKTGKGTRLLTATAQMMAVLEKAIYKGESGYAALSSYWHGRILLIRANLSGDETLARKYREQACAFFRKEERRVSHGQPFPYEKYTDGTILPTPVMLSAIELLDPKLRAVDQECFLCLDDVCRSVIQGLMRQVNQLFLLQGKPVVRNSVYCVQSSDVLDNLDRFDEVSDDIADAATKKMIGDLKSSVTKSKDRFW